MMGIAGTSNALLMAKTAQQLQVGLQLLGQLQPFTITLVNDMSVPASSWPKGIVVNYAMVLAGMPPPAPRTILDLYQVRVCAEFSWWPLCHTPTIACISVCSSFICGICGRSCIYACPCFAVHAMTPPLLQSIPLY